jgi:pyrroline-5-carboxylate reductase
LMHRTQSLLVAGIMAASVGSALVPESIGVVGVGTISSAAVRGLCRSSNAQFVLSPRNAAKAQALEQEFDTVRIATDNQAVVDACDCVLLAVLPGQAEQVCEPLQFREGQLVISLMAGVPLSDIERWCGPAECALACPLPAIAENAGTTIVTPPEPRTVAVFEKLGTAVPVATEDQFKRLQAMTCVMGDLYARQKTAQDWLVANGVDATAASAYVGGVFHTMTHDARNAKPSTLADLVAEQTPGGMNEMVISEQRADGAYASLEHSLDSIYSRLCGAHDPSLAPAKRRK